MITRTDTQSAAELPRRHFLVSVPVVVLLLALTTPRAASSQPHVVGKWTRVNELEWSGTALAQHDGTHMALLRGNSDSTWVLHWDDGGDERLWLVLPMQDSSKAFAVPNNQSKLFCAGHSFLKDGRLLGGGPRPAIAGSAT